MHFHAGIGCEINFTFNQFYNQSPGFQVHKPEVRLFRFCHLCMKMSNMYVALEMKLVYMNEIQGPQV